MRGTQRLGSMSNLVLAGLVLGLNVSCGQTTPTATSTDTGEEASDVAQGHSEAENGHSPRAENQAHEHAAANHTGHGHTDGHGAIEIPPGQPVPTINLVAHADPMRGWNLEIQTTNFQFAPEQVNQTNQPNVGHGHLYINGEKGARVYGPWLHLPELPPGRNEITVSLNANGHEALIHDGQAIETIVVIEVPD
ncbi:hypothetical protein [Leptolyngbya sp. PCC 6406]|uniref:hypothetical protein n=1 Tax=Leptolyngbya sp. PCC 6406 TaxID=1173264 RepID=UPI0002AC8EBA|nr:hypothetical protein [Leptolyngbya sp. PCC 6406]